MRCVSITSSDDRMDCREMFCDPINPLPRRCVNCGFPDLDHIPQPYFLIKSRTLSPNELAQAENGNFFVRERVRRVLDLVAPGQCRYFPTCFKGTTEQTPWLLVVPLQQVVSALVDPSIARCDVCGEPCAAHPGTQWTKFLLRTNATKESWTCDLDQDIVKSATWGSSERGWNQWIFRDLYLSVRLLNLLKQIKAKGFHQATCQKPAAPDKDENAWIKEQLRALEQVGISLHANGTLSDEDAKWLRTYLKSHSRKVESRWDVKAVERRVWAKLPKSYLDFVSAIGSASFENIDEQAGFTAIILGPHELEVACAVPDGEGAEFREINALTFATTGHGDSFCFDVQPGKKEHAVFLYKHEADCLEPYADNFAACIKRFAATGPGK